MKRWLVCAGVLLGLILSQGAMAQAAAAKAPSAGMDVYDGFETPALSDVWSADRFTPGSVEMQRDVVRAGQGAVKITVRPRDTFESGQNGNNDSERDELREADALFSQEGVGYEYSFSMYLPQDFPIVPTRLVIAQWKQACGSPKNIAAGDSKLPCSDDSPVLAFRYVSGELRISQRIGGKQTVLYAEKGEFRGRWLDFRIDARFSPSEDGRVKVWLGEKQLVDFKGVTADAEGAATGYPTPSTFYFKMGLYRDVMSAPMTIYIDEYRKRELGKDLEWK